MAEAHGCVGPSSLALLTAHAGCIWHLALEPAENA
jgi:hypothetical protein